MFTICIPPNSFENRAVLLSPRGIYKLSHSHCVYFSHDTTDSYHSKMRTDTRRCLAPLLFEKFHEHFRMLVWKQLFEGRFQHLHGRTISVSKHAMIFTMCKQPEKDPKTEQHLLHEPLLVLRNYKSSPLLTKTHPQHIHAFFIDKQSNRSSWWLRLRSVRKQFMAFS